MAQGYRNLLPARMPLTGTPARRPAPVPSRTSTVIHNAITPLCHPRSTSPARATAPGA